MMSDEAQGKLEKLLNAVDIDIMGEQVYITVKADVMVTYQGNVVQSIEKDSIIKTKGLLYLNPHIEITSIDTLESVLGATQSDHRASQDKHYEQAIEYTPRGCEVDPEED